MKSNSHQRQWHICMVSLVISCLILFYSFPVCSAVPCKPVNQCWKLSHSKATLFAGTPHRVLEVRPTTGNNEFCDYSSYVFAPICKYTYQIVMQRPGRDISNGSRGVLPVYPMGSSVPWDGHSYVLTYEVSIVGKGGSLDWDSKKMSVSMQRHPDNNKIILNLKEGLRPGIYDARISLNPRYKIGKLSASIDSLGSIPTSLSPIPGLLDAAKASVLKLEALGSDRRKKADVIRFVVSARMPNTMGVQKTSVDKRLKARGLTPNPNPVYTNDPNKHRLVITQYRKKGTLISPGVFIPYKYWVYKNKSKPTSTKPHDTCTKEEVKRDPVRCVSW